MDEFTIACIIKKIVPLAVLVTDTVTETWLPKSAIQNWDDDEMVEGCEVDLEIPERLAIEKGFA